ncbi:hypothetical protein NMQ14_10245 [Methyloversatilis sp. XJ19-13]|nr:hypothetical protein [Methyloversatilis sp. XJ19-13]MCQ9374629.1 hypothetical protein [Methyloversatilis sp. XJ19-13]
MCLAVADEQSPDFARLDPEQLLADAVVLLLALKHQWQLGYPDPDTPKG